MQISSKYVGAVSKPLEVEVTARQGMNYAASIGDDNPLYFDDLAPEGIISPPMLAIALTWRISEHFSEFWGDAEFPYDALARQVHYSERLRWLRPIRPGDRLRIEGTVVAVLPHRAGTHLIIEYVARTPAGDEVFVERIGGLLRGVKCEDAGQGEDSVPVGAIAADTPPLWTKSLHISKLAAHLYDGCADVHFPIHISPAFARFVGLPGIIFQGTGLMATAVSEMVLAAADNDPRRIHSAHCRFTGMVAPGTDIELRVLAERQCDQIQEWHFVVLNAHGKAALSDGCVAFTSP